MDHGKGRYPLDNHPPSGILTPHPLVHSLPTLWETHPLLVTYGGDTHPLLMTSGGDYPPPLTISGGKWNSNTYGFQSGGMRPTWMLSCGRQCLSKGCTNRRWHRLRVSMGLHWKSITYWYRYNAIKVCCYSVSLRTFLLNVSVPVESCIRINCCLQYEKLSTSIIYTQQVISSSLSNCLSESDVFENCRAPKKCWYHKKTFGQTVTSDVRIPLY